jgi:predicted lactoylglutathione lyase
MQHNEMFVNLPIRDMARSRAFYEALGYRFNPQFTNDQGACLVLGNNLYAMLLVRDFFATFVDRPISDARQTVQVLVALSCAGRAEVDALASKALAAGATEPRPTQDLGFMYSRSFADPDGHIWEPFHMQDPGQAQSTQAATGATAA